MKKFVVMGALALALAVCSQQEASAWVNTKFGVGLNWGYQSGGNNFLWGVFRNGQPPCCDGPGCGPGYGPGYFGPAYGGPGYHAQGFQGGNPYAQGADMAPVGPMVPQSPAAVPTMPRPQPSSSLQNNSFQTVNFPMYYVPGYYYPVSYER
jgi:hypothetical protein